MSKGKVRVNYLGGAGLVQSETAPWDYIYRVSTVKDPKWNIGDGIVLPDGREYRYAKSSGQCNAGQAAEFVATGIIPYTLLSVGQSVGDRQLTFVASTHAEVAKDELRGGFCVTWPVADDNKDQTRGIIGNDASAEDAAITVYLDGPLTTAVTITTAGEVYENPYAALRTGSQAIKAKAGIPATYVSAADMYFWVLVRGFTFIAVQADMITNKIDGFFKNDGSVQADQDGSDASYDSTQYAGHRVIGDYDNNGPLFLLKG